mgnify:CR=1 FL=1
MNQSKQKVVEKLSSFLLEVCSAHNIVGLEVEKIKIASCKVNYRCKIVVELEIDEMRLCFASSATSFDGLLQYAASFFGFDIFFSSTVIV